MSNQIVPLSTTLNADGSFCVSGVFWFPNPWSVIIPSPRFFSQVPFVDQATLAALRTGALIEQTFTSQNISAGTSLAVVQGILETEYTNALAALQANVASFANGLLGTEWTGSAWSPVSTAGVFDPGGRNFSAQLAASSGLLPGLSAGFVTGYCATSAAALVPIRATTYAPLGGAGAQISFASASANDSAAGTGAQQITVTYLDAAFAVHTEVVTLNGITPVNTVGANYCYLESIVVSRVGTSGGTNAGVISALTTVGGGGTVWGSIAASGGVGDGKTFWAHHYVPAGVTCYLLSEDFGTTPSAAAITAQQLSVSLLMRTGNPSATNLPKLQIGPTVQIPYVGDYREHGFPGTGLPIMGPDLIIALTRPLGASATTSYGNFEFIQF